MTARRMVYHTCRSRLGSARGQRKRDRHRKFAQEAAIALGAKREMITLHYDIILKRTDVEKMKVWQAAVETATSIFDDFDAFDG